MKSFLKKDKTEMYIFAESKDDKITLERLWDLDLVIGSYSLHLGKDKDREPIYQLCPQAVALMKINNTIGWVKKKEEEEKKQAQLF